jgi:hypothetical protein
MATTSTTQVAAPPSEREKAAAALANTILNGNPALIHGALTEAYNAYLIHFGSSLDQKLSMFLSKDMYADGLLSPDERDTPIYRIAAQLIEQLQVHEMTTFRRDDGQPLLTCQQPTLQAMGWISGYLGVAFMAGHRFAQLEAQEKHSGSPEEH